MAVVVTIDRVQLTTGIFLRSLYQTCPTLTPSAGTQSNQIPGFKSFMIHTKVFVDWTYSLIPWRNMLRWDVFATLWDSSRGRSAHELAEEVRDTDN